MQSPMAWASHPGLLEGGTQRIRLVVLVAKSGLRLVHVWGLGFKLKKNLGIRV